MLGVLAGGPLLVGRQPSLCLCPSFRIDQCRHADRHPFFRWSQAPASQIAWADILQATGSAGTACIGLLGAIVKGLSFIWELLRLAASLPTSFETLAEREGQRCTATRRARQLGRGRL